MDQLYFLWWSPSNNIHPDTQSVPLSLSRNSLRVCIFHRLLINWLDWAQQHHRYKNILHHTGHLGKCCLRPYSTCPCHTSCSPWTRCVWCACYTFPRDMLSVFLGLPGSSDLQDTHCRRSPLCHGDNKNLLYILDKRLRLHFAAKYYTCRPGKRC